MRSKLVSDLARAAVRVLACLLAAYPLIWADEQAAPFRRVTIEEIRQLVGPELRARGLAQDRLPSTEDIDLPVAVPRHSGSSLRISSTCWDSDAGRTRFRLECEPAGSCVPFLVYVRTPAHVESSRCGPTSRQPNQRPTSVLAVHAGEHATAVLLSAGMRMTAAVTCLDRGDRGEIIRVRGQEGRIFRARVEGPALVEALLE